MHGRKSVMAATESPRKQPWRPWPNSKDNLQTMPRHLGEDGSPTVSPHSPMFDEYDAKLPPYFAQASPRGHLPRLNLAASMQASSDCDSPMLSPAKHGARFTFHAPRVSKGKSSRDQSHKGKTGGTRMHHSLNSLFETARHAHRHSLEKGWCSERSHQLARETRRFGSRYAPDRPPSSTRLRLPGVNSRYRQRLWTPLEERTAGEQGGHAGLVTALGRIQLSEDLITPLLEMAVNSTNEEMRGQAPPAISALAGIAANRAVLGAYGAVEQMLHLACSGKKTATRLDAWDTLHSLCLSSEAAMRFKQLGGIAAAVSSRSHKDARVKRKAAMTLERLLSKGTLTLDQRLEVENIRALCQFVCCGDPQASEAAGSALWSIARHSVKEVHPWPEEGALALARSLVHEVEMLDEPAPSHQGRATKLFRGYTLTVKALSLLVEKHKGFRNRLCKDSGECLALLYRALAHNAAMMGRVPLESDIYYARTISTLGMSTRTAIMMQHPDLVKWASAAVPRLLFMLQEAMPSHWGARRKQISRIGSGGEGILPLEDEMVHHVALISNRNSFGLPAIRQQLVSEGFLPTLLELCTHREAKIRQNAASCLFYLLHEDEVQAGFGNASHWCSSSSEGPWLTLLSALATTQDPLAKMTILRVLEKLCKKIENIASLYKAGMVSVLCDVMVPLLASNNVSMRTDKKAFPLLKNAFCCADLLLTCMDSSDTILIESDERGVLVWLLNCCNDILSFHGAKAWHAMTTTGKLKLMCLEYVKRQAQEQGHERLDRVVVGEECRDEDADSAAEQESDAGGREGDVGGVTEHEVGECGGEKEREYIRDESSSAGAASDPTPQVGVLEARVGEILREIGFSVPIESSTDKSLQRDQKSNIDKIRHTFYKYDYDGSGTIDGDELHGLLRDLGHLCTREEALLIMAGMDPNGDGSVDFDEFNDWCCTPWGSFL